MLFLLDSPPKREQNTSGFNDRKRKVLQQDVDTDDKEERAMTQQPRAQFAAMEPSADQDTLEAGHTTSKAGICSLVRTYCFR